MNNQNRKFTVPALIVVGLCIVSVYASVVFLGQALLFATYQYLRDRGWGFWDANMIITIFFTLLALPPIVRKIMERK